MHRVYFDRNVGPPKEGHGDRYGLWLDKSREDLAKIPGGPREGKVVTIYMIGEIEMEATLEWDAKWQAWTGRPVERTIRDNHETWASSKLTLETREVRPFVENRNCPDCGGSALISMRDGLKQIECPRCRGRGWLRE